MIRAAYWRFVRLETGDDRRALVGLVLAASILAWHIVATIT